MTTAVRLAALVAIATLTAYYIADIASRWPS